LRFLPGTHKLNVEPYQLDRAQFLRTDIPENQILLDKQVCVPLEPGDVIFFHCMTFHAAMRNRSSNAKKSVIFTYRPSNNPPIAGTRSASMPELLLLPALAENVSVPSIKQ
jgi:phytanoyl-CoA hydroxylase